jgi:hypothetical protein
MQLQLFFSSLNKLKKMKTKIIVALLATVALCTIVYIVLSNGICNPPIPKNKQANIVGSWKVDTAYNNKDSNSLGLIWLALLDSGSIFKFNTDSSLQTISLKGTITNYYVLKGDSLIVKEGNSLDTVTVKFIADSMVSLTQNDSSVLLLKRISK